MPIMRTAELAAKLNITRQSLQNYIRHGEISRPSKDSKGYVWSEVDIDQVKKMVNLKSESQRHISSLDTSLKIQNRRYLGSKQKMLSFISEVVNEHTENVDSVADIFGGTGVVADLFHKQGKKIIINDLLYSNFVSYNTWFGNEIIDYDKIEKIIEKLNKESGFSGYVTEKFGNRYFSLENAKKIDGIREYIAVNGELNQREKDTLLTSLIYAADKVANTVGHFDAYRKKEIEDHKLILRVPEITENHRKNLIFNLDANDLVKKIDADLVYIDTPYNSRGYENAYHVLENIAEWKKPEVEGVTRKAVNRSEKSSDYTKSKAPDAFKDLISNISARYILVSYNNMEKKGNSRSNAKISKDEIYAILSSKGEVVIFETDFNPFTTGQSHIKNHKELLYLCKVKQAIL